MSESERPWMPGRERLRWSVGLINPHGDRHLGFSGEEGRFYRLWEHRPSDPLDTGDAILLRPSDIDVIIRLSVIWVMEHPRDPRCYAVVDEIAAGAKTVVMHFAGLGAG